MTGTLVPPWYKEEPTTRTGLLVAAFFFGASVAVAAFDVTKAVRQSHRSWHRRHRATTYVVMLWAARRLKLGLLILIGLVNISVFCIWIPARLQINDTYMRINYVWDRIEKAIFAAIDFCMNAYFMWLVKSKLVSNGLTQYNRLYKYNLAMVTLSISLDVLLIGLMSLKDDAVYVQVHPLMYLVKLNIEMNMAELIAKVVRRSQDQRSTLPSTDIWRPYIGMGAFDREWLGSAKDFMIPSGGEPGDGLGGGKAPGQMIDLNMDILNESGQREGSIATRPRSSTKGPLDDDGPLASPLSADQVQRTLSLRSHPRSPAPGSPMIPRSPAHSPAPTGKRLPGMPSPRHGPKDFSYLLRPEIYHPLTPLNIPPSFRNPPNPPAPDTPIPDLLARGHFRAAAIAATQTLTNNTVDPTDHARIFDLLYTRLACLTLIDSTALAAQEVKALGDLHSAFYYVLSSDSTPQQQQQETTITTTDPPPSPTPQQQQHLVPWSLRLLAVRLQALGFGDPRRAVMSYYELAREARTRLATARAAHDHSAAEVWKERLSDLGVRVAGALVEMDDLAGAAVHLGTLGDRGMRGERGEKNGDGMVGVRRALLWLHLGDVEAARGCMGIVDGDGGEGGQEGSGGVEAKVVGALCDMADGAYERALGRWKELWEEVDDEMVGVNLAVCLLYLGKMQEASHSRLWLVDSGRSSHTLLFNLSTMYELCTDRSRALKVSLSEKVAARGDRVEGWEKTNADFKLQ
ncbi:uncharacterized protein C8A04DRAFT_10092 [Dichotomopilus funicola]|uniref:Uncharacterized protein n=1 Tax=Dichotomopilus funicola TaxID=1934379 RepID=A0AAN6ZPY0_9PEZI|nr:hypothetical protein C8A04DRAFT_10092 [Dichotomopilus funicola]